jgi:hypothetical protein
MAREEFGDNDGEVETIEQRPLGELLRTAKSDASRQASENGKIRTRQVWSADRRRRHAEGTARAAAAKRAAKTGESGTEETILEVKSDVPPEKPKSVSKDDVSRFAEALILMHVFVAGAIKTDKVIISRVKAENLSSALQNVGRWYGATTIISERSWDWINLGIVSMGTYGPMWAEVRAEILARKAKPVQPPPGINPAGGFERAPQPQDGHFGTEEQVMTDG